MGTITASFFSAYELGGVAHLAIDVVRELHDQGVRPRPANEPLQGKWKQVYTEALPGQVKEQTGAFDFSQITGGRISPIIAEIESELKGLDGECLEQYLFSLLTPFRELAGILNPVTSNDKDCILIEPKPKRRAEITKRFCEVLDNANIGTIEYYCSVWVDAALQYANRLDALLLTKGIDILQLQEKSGIYLKNRREITDVEYYIGSYKLARRYINALEPRHLDALRPGDAAHILPGELEGARVFFERAVNNGYMEMTATGGKWLKKQSVLGYFCMKAFEQPRPITALEGFFNVRNLAASITQVDIKDNEVKRADVKKWRAKIKEEIFQDSPD